MIVSIAKVKVNSFDHKTAVINVTYLEEQEIKRVPLDNPGTLSRRKKVSIVLSAPEAVANRADILGGDEGFSIDIIDHAAHSLDVLAQDADGEHCYGAILAARRDLSNSVAFSPQAFSDGSSAARTDDP